MSVVSMRAVSKVTGRACVNSCGGAQRHATFCCFIYDVLVGYSHLVQVCVDSDCMCGHQFCSQVFLRR